MKKIIITSALTLALSLGACTEQKTAEQLIASAQQYSEQGKYANAIIDYKNSVRLSPKNADARLGLGRAYLNQGLYVSAEKELDRALELGASFAQIVSLQVQVKTRLEKYSEVEELVRLSEDLDDKSYLIVLTYAGISALANNETAKAQDYFSQAAAMNSGVRFSQLASAYLLYSEKNIAEALTGVNALLSTDENFAEAIRLQAYLYFSSKDFEQASQAFARYMLVYPRDYHIQFFRVNALLKAEKFDQANVLTDKLLKYFKKSPLALQYKSQIEFQGNNYISARDYASQAIGLDEGFIIAKMIAGVSSYKLDELEQAYDYLIGLEDMLSANHPANVILLSIKIKLGHTDDLAQSVAKLKALKNNESNIDLLQITSAELIKGGDYASAQSLLNKAANVSPNNASIKVRQGALLLSRGDLSGIKSLEQALKIDPTLHEIEFALARQYLRGNEVTKAQAIATKWLASEQYRVSGNILLGLIASHLEDVNEAEKYFNKALALEENNISALYSLASVYDFKKQTEEAITGYKKVIELNPNHHNAIRRYSVLQTSQGKTAVAISFLSTLYDQSKLTRGYTPKNLVIGLAQMLSVSGKIQAGIELLESLKKEKNLPDRYWSVLAATYEMNGQNTPALTAHEQAIKINPNSYILRMSYIAALDKLRKYPQALVIAVQAKQDFPHNENLITTVAYLELATEANAAMAENNYQQAINLYSEIYIKTPNKYNLINLARALDFSKQGDKAEKTVENYLSKNGADTQVRMLLAELYGKHNTGGTKSTKIIETYQAVLKLQPKRVDALNNLAWQQYLINDLANANRHIEQAIALAPSNISIQESYGVILVANKEFNKAIEVITKVLKKGSVDVNVQVSLAEAYIAVKQPSKAKAILTGLSAHDSNVNLKITKLKHQVSND